MVVTPGASLRRSSYDRILDEALCQLRHAARSNADTPLLQNNTTMFNAAADAIQQVPSAAVKPDVYKSMAKKSFESRPNGVFTCKQRRDDRAWLELAREMAAQLQAAAALAEVRVAPQRLRPVT